MLKVHSLSPSDNSRIRFDPRTAAMVTNTVVLIQRKANMQSWSRWVVVLAGIAPILWGFGFPPAASAKVCGAETPCACGDKVEGVAKLRGDLSGCGRIGLRVAASATLDCDGHSIEGQGKDISKYGVYLNGSDDAVVRGCTVSHFERGIRVRGGRRVRVEHNRVH